MRKRGPQRHMALLLAAVLLLPLFAVPSSGYAETPYFLSTQISITNADNPAAPITRESPVSFSLGLQLGNAPTQHWEQLKNEVFYLYLLRGLFAGAEQIDIVNPFCGTGSAPYAQERVFAADMLTREPERDLVLDGIDYICYSIRLNTGANAQAYYAAEAPAMVSFTFTKLLGQGMAATELQRVALVQTRGGEALGEGSITIIDSLPEQPTLPQASISIAMHSRYVWDSAFLAGDAGGDAGAYVPSEELGYCTPGDLCVFQIELSNPHATPLTLFSLTEYLPEGYRLPDWSAAKMVVRNGTPEEVSGGEALLPAGALPASWQPAGAANAYQYTWDTPAVLQPGSSIALYLPAEVQSGGSLLHAVSAQQENGMQPTASYEPVRSGQHDMALTVKIEDVYNPLNEPVAGYPDARPVPTVAGARLGIRFRAENQGQAVGSVSLVAYVPPGFAVLDAAELFPGGSNAGWALETQIPMDTANGIWAPLSVYRYSFTPAQPLQTLEACEAMLYVAVQGAIGEQRTGGYPEDVYLPTDYYIAGEIATFTDPDGAPAMDADSTPDSNPANDLFDNRTGITRYHPINLYQKAQEGAFFGEVKEAPGNTMGRAKLRYGLLQDEDDFDFDYAAPARGGIAQPEYGAYVSTRRLPAQDTQAAAIQHFGEWAVAYISGPPEYNGLGLTPAGEDGTLHSTRSYMLYEFWVNRDGLADTTNSSLQILLPEGMTTPAYRQAGALPGALPSDLIRVYKYQPLQRAPGLRNPSLQIIRYDPGFVAEREVVFTGGATGSLSNAGLLPEAANTQEQAAAAYGISGRISDDRRSITLQFGAPAGGSQAHLDTTGAYRILLLAAVDQAHIQYTPMRVQARYQYRGMELSSEEEVPLSWGTASDPFLLLGAWDAHTGHFAQSPVFAIATPEPGGRLLARYRLRFRSEYTLAAGSLYLENVIPEDIFEAFSNVQITGYQSPGLESAEARIAGQLPVLARSDSRKNALHIRNPWPTGDGQHYDITYDVQYRNIRYGQLLQNNAGGAVAQVITPLSLSAAALDGRTNAFLSGCTFALYYAAEDGSADLARPIRNISGLPVQFSDAGGASLFLPEGYAPGLETTWDAVLTQTAAPAGYESHIGLAFPLAIRSDAAGGLAILPASGEGFHIAVDSLGAAQLQLYNTAPSPITIYAADRGNANKPLAGAVFQLTRPDGRTELLPATGRNGRASFLPNAPVSGDYAGDYLLQAVAAPQIYTTDGLETICVRLDAAGAIASVQGDSTAYLNSDYVSLTALFSPLAQPVANAIPLGGRIAPTPSPGLGASAIVARAASMEQTQSNRSPHAAQAALLLADELPAIHPQLSRGMLLLLGCMALAAEVLLLYSCIRAHKRKKETYE